MTLRALLIGKAAVSLAFGIYLLVAPASLLGLWGAGHAPSGAEAT